MSLKQWLLIVSVLLNCWLGMQAIHEFGHLIGAWATGGRVSRVVLHPLTISRTDLSNNPAPLMVVWAGPILGSALPLVVWGVAASLRLPHTFLLRFFAAFCLVANGLYIAVGSWDQVGDCREMLRNGSQIWHLWLFGACTVPLGFRLWHRQGRHFGLGTDPHPIATSAVLASVIVTLLLVIQGLVIGGE